MFLINKALKAYFQHIKDGISTTWVGMKLTLKHLWAARRRRSQNNIQEEDYFNQQNGMVTLQYPLETMPIPDHGRYRLHNEMDDCIVCDKCAKVCPVNCIDIEPIKATGEVGKASDGSPIRLYAAKFDIDMAKCCYCGLCTTVCPTECLTMTKTFDYSEFDVRDMNYHYANLSPAEAEEKKALYEQFVKEKEALKQPSVVGSSIATDNSESVADSPKAIPKPVFRPKAKPLIDDSVPMIGSEQPTVEKEVTKENTSKPKTVFKPKAKPAIDSLPPTVESDSLVGSAPNSEPSVGLEPTDSLDSPQKENIDLEEERPRPKPIFKPTKPKMLTQTDENEVSNKPWVGLEPTDSLDSPQKENTGLEEVKPRPKPIFKPTMKPKKEE